VKSLDVVNPAGMAAPRGYSHGVLAPAGARTLFVAGQIGWDGAGRLVGADFVQQFEQALRNILTVVTAAGGGAHDLVRLTVYVTDRAEYSARLAPVGEAYRRVMGRHYPAMALVEVKGLVEPGAKVEIEATAAIA
jgi:enamine deaminase RidA (YjgF/YER057c/UK114 family)